VGHRFRRFFVAAILGAILGTGTAMVVQAGFSGIWPWTRQPVTVACQTDGSKATVAYVDAGEESFLSPYPIPQTASVVSTTNGIVLRCEAFLERKPPAAATLYLPIVRR
jgi:hypothetical protein